jgi:hypothetical protein
VSGIVAGVPSLSWATGGANRGAVELRRAIAYTSRAAARSWAGWGWLVAFMLLFARVGHLSLPWVALVAPAVCSVCHGCPVAHDHDVCDCEACQQEAAGVGPGLLFVKNAPHGGPSWRTDLDDLRFLVPAPLRLVRRDLLIGELDWQAPVLSSLPRPPPPLPPPRVASA